LARSRPSPVLARISSRSNSAGVQCRTCLGRWCIHRSGGYPRVWITAVAERVERGNSGTHQRGSVSPYRPGGRPRRRCEWRRRAPSAIAHAAPRAQPQTPQSQTTKNIRAAPVPTPTGQTTAGGSSSIGERSPLTTRDAPVRL